MFHVYTAALRPIPKRSHKPHRKTSTSTETDPHQQSPEYTQHTPKTGTHVEQAPPHPPVHSTPTHQRPLACSEKRCAKTAHTDKHRGAKSTGQSSVHTSSTRNSPPADTNIPQHNQPNHPQGTQKPQSRPRTSQ